MITRFVTTALALTVSASLFAADVYTVDKSHSETSFKVRHFVSKTPGRFTDFDGRIVLDQKKPEASSVEFTINAASIDTDNGDRDKHLRSADFFDVEKYPQITFKSSSVKPAGKDKFNVTGTLSMHGVSRQVTLPVAFLGFVKDPWGGHRAGFEIATKLNRKDYGIVWNKTLDEGGVLLGEEVDITINLETVKQKAEQASR